MEMPEQVQQVTSFLEHVGLSRVMIDEANGFGSGAVTYKGNGIGVRVVSDRGAWFIEVSGSERCTEEWYDMALLRDLLGDSGPDVLTLPEQAAILTRQWSDIQNVFQADRANENCNRLEALREERAKRRFPSWFK